MLLEMVGGLTGWTVGSFSDDLLASCGELRKCAVRVFPGLLGLRENGTNFQKSTTQDAVIFRMSVGAELTSCVAV